MYSDKTSEVKPARLDDDTKRQSRVNQELILKTMHFDTELIRIVKIIRCGRPETLA